MSVELPGWLQWLGWVVGSDWPVGDEDAMRRLSDAWTAMGTALGDASDNGDQAADLVMTALDAADGRAFDRTWSTYSGDDEAYLSKLKEACDGLAKLCAGCAEDIEYAKYTFYVMLALLAIDIIIMIAAAAETFGASLAEIAIEEGLTQLAARRVATTVVEKIAERAVEKAAEFEVKSLVKGAAVSIAKGMLPDVGAQLAMTAQGHEAGGWNFARTGNTALSAGAGAAVGAGADLFGGKTGAGRVIFGDNLLGQSVKGAVTGAATPLVVGTLPGQETPSWHDVAEGATGGAAGGAVGFAKDRALGWARSTPDGGHVAIPDVDPDNTSLASASRPVATTDTSTVDTSMAAHARSHVTADGDTASPAGEVAHASAPAHADTGTPAGAVRTESARSTAHAAPDRTRGTETARHDTGDGSPTAGRPRRTVERPADPVAGSGAGSEVAGGSTRDDGDAARHGADGGTSAERARKAGDDASEPGRERSRTSDPAAAHQGGGEDRTGAGRAPDRARAADRDGNADDARHAADRPRTANESHASSPTREETHERTGPGSGTTVNRIDAVLNPPARPARPTGSDTAPEAETTNTSARRTVPAEATGTARHRTDDPALGNSATADSVDTNAAERPASDAESIKKLGYDPHDPGFRDPGEGINTVHDEGREWVRLGEGAGWHRVEYRSTDERYAGKGFAARLKTFVDKYFPGRDGRTAEELFNEARGKIDTDPPGDRASEFERISGDEARQLAAIRTESQTIVPDDVDGTHRIIQKVLPAEGISPYESGEYGGISGFVTKLVDVVHLRTPRSIVRALRLDYNESPYRPEPREIYAIRMKLTEHQAEHEVVIPSSQRMMELAPPDAGPPRAFEGEKAPFSGTGFGADPADGAPELKAANQDDPHGAIALQDGAEMWRISTDGREDVYAVYHSGSWHRTAAAESG